MSVEEAVVKALKRRAAEAGVSAEEAHRRILRKELGENRSFVEHLLAIPAADDEGDDWMFERSPDTGIRDIDW